jgi:hypothetical protein
MQKFFFAGYCLRVLDKSDFLLDSPLSFFKSKIPYSCDAFLELYFGILPEYTGSTYVSEGMGVRIADLGGGRWLFLSTDTKNRCSLEASDNYEKLQGYVEAGQNSNRGVLQENFIKLLRLAAECRMAADHGLGIHASCVCLNGRAVLFSAPAGTGKSTQAALWEKCLGADMLSGDRPFLHMRDEALYASGVPWDGKERVFLQKEYPVSAIVEVRRGKRNLVRKLNSKQAFKLLAQQCLIPMWDDTAKFEVLKTIRQISGRVPCYRFFCLPDPSSAEVMRRILFDDESDRLEKEQPDMKIKEGFLLKNVMDEWVVMPTGRNIKNFEGAIVLNEVAAFIWKQMEQPVSEEDVLQSVLDEYETDEKTAKGDLSAVLGQLRELEILQES